jgi:uncharacterized protein YbaP (TraB family)
MKKLIIGLLPVLGIVACHSTQKVTYTPEQILPQEKSLLWKISANGIKKPSYLYGTIHIIPREDFELEPQVIEGLNDCDYVVFEIDMKEMMSFKTQLSMLSKCTMAGGTTLSDLLSEEDLELVKSELEEMGIPFSMANKLKPLFTSTILSGDDDTGSLMGNANMTSVEMEIWKLAKKRDMSSAGLETADYQLSVFDSIPYEAQARMLVETIKGNSSGTAEFAQMVEMYKTKDINAMQNSIDSDAYGYGEYADVLLNNRNSNWIPVMSDIMRRQPAFFAVGAGHLGGEEGVIALLRREGFRVEAVE